MTMKILRTTPATGKSFMAGRMRGVYDLDRQLRLRLGDKRRNQWRKLPLSEKESLLRSIYEECDGPRRLILSNTNWPSDLLERAEDVISVTVHPSLYGEHITRLGRHDLIPLLMQGTLQQMAERVVSLDPNVILLAPGQTLMRCPELLDRLYGRLNYAA